MDDLYSSLLPRPTLSELQQRFPDWEIYRSEHSQWWALRPLTDTEHHRGCSATLNAPTPGGLMDQLQAQKRLRNLIARAAADAASTPGTAG